MMMFNAEKMEKMAKNTLNLAILVTLLVEIINPAPVSAKTSFFANVLGRNSSIETTMSANPESRMISPKTTLKVPDMIVDTLITAYSSTIDQCDNEPFIAASGKRVYDGMVAANFLPLGTKIKIAPAVVSALTCSGNSQS